MSKNIIEKKKKNVMSLAQFYNFIVSHQSPTRVQNKIPAPVHQLTKLTTLVRGVIDLFSETNFLSRPDKYQFEDKQRVFRSNTNERLQTTNEGRKEPNRRDLYQSLSLFFFFFALFTLILTASGSESFESLLVCIRDVVEKSNLE